MKLLSMYMELRRLTMEVILKEYPSTLDTIVSL